LLDTIAGDFVILCQAGDLFYPDLLTHFYTKLAKDDSGDWFYYDCEYKEEGAEASYPLFKPPTYSPALLLSINYLSRGFIRTSLLQRFAHIFNADESLFVNEYKMALKLYEIDRFTRHIPGVLISQNNLVKPESSAIQKVIFKHLSQLGLKNVNAQSLPAGNRFSWDAGQPSVAIVIPTKNNQRLLAPCLESLIKITTYDNFSIHIVDNNSNDPGTRRFYDVIESEPRIKIHPYPQAFNYSQANNLGAKKSMSDLLLFLNDDMEIFDPKWLEELVQWAVRPEIGVVGGKLIRSSRIIQHAGIVMGLNGFAGHIYLNAPEHYQGLFGSVNWYRDYLAVTGACQMMRREVFEEVGGYDEGFRLAFGDIDLCLRIHEKGYRNIYTPFATLYHYEGKSRGYATPREDILRAYTKMKSYLSTEDPNFSPNLTYTRIPKCVSEIKGLQERKEQYETRKKFYSNK
jgi:GT2 family glycosyltransferase